ncbi:MAG: YwiC-like family protein [Nitrospirae bacterium]|nr:YwiC-like family protein [Nitrospirota bacterium]
MKIPLVKEHGAWFVFLLSFASGIIAGYPIMLSSFSEALPGLFFISAGLAFFINSKASLVSFLRTGLRNISELLWLAFFWSAGFILILPLLEHGLMELAPFLLLILIYVFFLFLKKEHLLFTELAGFALLTLSAPVAFFTVAGIFSIKLYIAVLIFFCAGVFKVRMRLRKSFLFRMIMALYCFFALAVYSFFEISLWILFPLLENVTNAALMRDEKLKTTGNTELAKGVLFLIFLGFFFSS